MSNQNSNTVIYLDRSRSPRAFDGQQTLWSEDLYRVLRLINQHVELLDGASQGGDCWDEDDSKDGRSRPRPDGEDQPFLSIAIFGPSGSGKSSLLSTLVREIRESRQRSGGFFHERGVLNYLDSSDPFYGQDEKGKLTNLHCKLATLKVLHPDTFAQDDNFLYAVLARALEEEKRVNDRRKATAESDILSPLQRQFQELSDYLRVLDPVEKSQDYDPLGLSLERMERHTSGLLLREKLREFLHHLPRSLGGPKGGVVLLPVDDVDMSPEHMVEILQIYQSFLLHPRFVPIFTFTDRTAEELLNVHFSRYLSPGSRAFDEPGEGTNRLQVSERLALQHLARCFPVRNRIRLGPAPARVQRAKYVSTTKNSGENGCKGTPVLYLLRTANFLLFGHPDWDKTHEVRAALRPSTLRRQLHVMDTLLEAGVEQNMTRQFSKPMFSDQPEEDQALAEKREDHWVRILNRSIWALLNVHRDVLREFDLYLEDLYSWSARALRRVVLDTLLDQDIHVRRALLRRWRDRADSRRSQVLSLLAMNMFKPWTPVEEKYGDDEYLYVEQEPAKKANVEGREGLLTNTVCLWFLELTIGFYMPLALARPRVTDSAETDSARSRIIGIGWGVESGPINAVRDADARQNMLPTGICFLNPEDFRDHLSPGDMLYKEKTFELKGRTRTLSVVGIEQEDDHEHRQHNELMMRLWCFYGYSQGRFWSAVSFWRGLGLLARILDRHRRHCYELKANDGSSTAEEVKTRAQNWNKRLRSLLRHHVLRGMIPVGLLGKISNEDQLRNISFKQWDQWESLKKDSRQDVVDLFVDKIVNWLESCGGIDACWQCQRSNCEGGTDCDRGEGTSSDSAHAPSAWNNRPLFAMPTDERDIGWRQNFMRRLHGEDILGDFHLRLATMYMQEQDQFFHTGSKHESFGLTAGAALLGWTGVLLEYWRGVYSMQRLLRSCPLLRPFVRGPVADILRSHLLDQEYEKLRYHSDHCGECDPCRENGVCQGKNGRLRREEADFLGQSRLKQSEYPKIAEKWSDSERRREETKFVKAAAKKLATLIKSSLKRWQRYSADELKEKTGGLEETLKLELLRHWNKIGPLPGQKEDFIVRNARELYEDQLRELYWANQEILTVRWLWSLKRVEWSDFEPSQQEEWVRARVVEMAEAPGARKKSYRPSRSHLVRQEPDKAGGERKPPSKKN